VWFFDPVVIGPFRPAKLHEKPRVLSGPAHRIAKRGLARISPHLRNFVACSRLPALSRLAPSRRPSQGWFFPSCPAGDCGELGDGLADYADDAAGQRGAGPACRGVVLRCRIADAARLRRKSLKPPVLPGEAVRLIAKIGGCRSETFSLTGTNHFWQEMFCEFPFSLRLETGASASGGLPPLLA